MAERGIVFDQIDELMRMKTDLTEPTMLELRGCNLANPRQRIESISRSNPNNMEKMVSSGGGNSPVYILERDRLRTYTAKHVVGHHLRDPDHKLPMISIYPFGVAGLTSDKRPIFQHPETTTMKSIVLEDQNYNSGAWLQRPIEPLFNIDQDGTVLARIADCPTPGELQLLNDILDRFEQANQS